MKLIGSLILALLLLPMNAHADTVEKIAGGFAFTEGIVENKKGELFFTDAPNNRIHKINLDGSVEVYREDSGSANGLAVASDDSLIVCEQSRGRLTRLSGDVTETLIDVYEGKPFNSPNDVVVASNGIIYFSDPSWGSQAPQTPAVYKLENQVVARLYDQAATPNGVQLSADEKTLFIGDTVGNRIIAYDINTGVSRLFAEITSPDGMAMDAKGNLYVAQFGVGQIRVFDPQGKSIRSIAVPEKAASNAGISRDGSTLFVTAGRSVYKIDLN